MKIAFFDTHRFEKKIFDQVNLKFGHDITYFEPKLTPETALLAHGNLAICSFVNDRLQEKTISILHGLDIKLIALRSAGFNHVDIAAANRSGMKVVRVPSYSPHAIAEHAVALILALNRKICRANSRIKELNFSLEGLVGFDLFGKTIGIIGTGKIGSVMASIMKGFGCRVIAFDPFPNADLQNNGITYLPLSELYSQSDIISLHVPLTNETKHLLNEQSLAKMKKGVMIINTGRGALIDTKALIDALKTSQIGAAGLDVYEEEENIFFQDLSDQVLQDDVLARLMTFPNVMITSHQAFLTQEALANIAETTLKNVSDFEQGLPLSFEVKI
jgi:D-lactate dehydrogenase